MNSSDKDTNQHLRANDGEQLSDASDSNADQEMTGQRDIDGNTAASYHDRDKVGSRANEASDRNDSNTGGMISGGAKGAAQS